jgi:Sec-independent protein secretion pathway component TatC
MKAVSGIVFSIIWLIITMMIGFIVVTQLVLNATANATGSLIGTAATQWTNFIALVWVSFGILALTPLVLVALTFMGLFGGFGGGK